MFESLRAFFRKPAAPVRERSYDAAAGGRRWDKTAATPSLQTAILSGREPVARRASPGEHPDSGMRRLFLTVMRRRSKKRHSVPLPTLTPRAFSFS
jgi:hypothetical protein